MTNIKDVKPMIVTALAERGFDVNILETHGGKHAVINVQRNTDTTVSFVVIDGREKVAVYDTKRYSVQGKRYYRTPEFAVEKIARMRKPKGQSGRVTFS